MSKRTKLTECEEAPSTPDAAAVRLSVSGVSKSFAGVQALNDVSLTLGEGEILALIGENGAGKSTLIKILSGAQAPDSGTVTVGGRPLVHHTPRESERLGVATVYQEMSLFPDLTVAENLMFQGDGPGLVNWTKMRRQARGLLASLGLELDVARTVRALSVAEKQMVEISKALRREANVLILDEPTAVLGGADVERLLDLVRGLRQRGVSVIFVSHRLDEVFGLADRYVVLKDGAVSGAGRIEETDHDHLVSQMVGRPWVRPERRASVKSERPILRVTGLNRAGVLRDITFDVKTGEIVGIAGLRGAGRTELARAIFGADPIDAGTIEIDGRHVEMSSPIDAIRAGLGLVPEERKVEGLFTNLSTLGNIPLAKSMKGAKPWVSPRADRATALRYKKMLRIRVADVDAPVVTLSGGNQQKVVLAKWLEAGVRVLILDEPTRGVDIGAKQEIYAQIQQLCEQGMGILMISSELPEILTLSDRILVMYQGGVEAELEAMTATEEQIMFHAVGGSE